MSFTSIEFGILFVTVLIGVAVTERFGSKRPKELILLGASYIFYGYWDWRFCFLLFFVTVSSYITAKFSYRKSYFVTGIIIPLVVLGFFKYFNFFISSFCGIFGKSYHALRIILPVGISFYTFQALSYVIDVHRGKISVEKDFIKLALYISFFPQLVAGPIVRASDFLSQLYEDRRVSLKNIEWGVQVFVFGLFKKIVLADHLSVFVDQVYRSPAAYNYGTIILALISYSLQIYFDFSGYSDMAIGCAKCFGYDFNKNFNLPYISQNVTEFWHRWHISLSTWLSEYLYIPLGGNRKGKTRQYINLMITMLLGGLWHGASWTFILWGGINGIALCIDKLKDKPNKRTSLSKCFNILITFTFISFTWVFFRADSFTTATKIIKGVLILQSGIRHTYIWSIVSIITVTIGTLFAYVKAHKNNSEIDGYYLILNLNSVVGLTIFFVEIGVIFVLAYTGENPFVYFQF